VTNILQDFDRDSAPFGTRVLYPDARMKQVQSGTSRPYLARRWWTIGSGSPRPMALGRRRSSSSALLDGAIPTAAWSLGRAVLALLAGAWSVATLPIRLTFWLMAWLGRLTGIAVGFTLMVTGMFFLAGPLFLIGIPLFLIGLVLTLRCLD
jgi:hypothetical protein